MTDNNSTYSSHKSKNLEFKYEYTNSFIERRLSNMDDLNKRLTTFIGFGGVLLRFSFELFEECPMCKLLKILSIIVLPVSIISAGIGLMAVPQGIGIAFAPKNLDKEDWLRLEPELLRDEVLKCSIESIPKIRNAENTKVNCLNGSISLIFISVFFFALNVLLATWFPLICK